VFCLTKGFTQNRTSRKPSIFLHKFIAFIPVTWVTNSRWKVTSDTRFWKETPYNVIPKIPFILTEKICDKHYRRWKRKYIEFQIDVWKKYQVFFTEAGRGRRNTALPLLPFNHRVMSEKHLYHLPFFLISGYFINKLLLRRNTLFIRQSENYFQNAQP
jgi:hypothetical protein